MSFSASLGLIASLLGNHGFESTLSVLAAEAVHLGYACPAGEISISKVRKR